MKDIKLILILAQVCLQISDAQFPSKCMKPDNIMRKECCPEFKETGTCGIQDGRGECGSITLRSDKSSVRNGWPYYFNRTCVCNGNYAGYDCGRCKYGYHGENCSEYTIIERRPISEFSPEDWKKYVDILNMSRSHDSDYMVFLTEPQPGQSDDISQLHPTPINLYDLFVWQHHYTAKDNDNKEHLKDYAHESTGFLTWHRQYLLWFEWEIQYMLKSMGHDDYYTFRIPYWDWRKEMQTDSNSPFQRDRLGETVNINGLPQVHGGEVFPSNWQTICWDKSENKSHTICNPQVPTGQLQRCPLSEDSCNSGNPLWPTDKDIQTALSLKSYDTSPFKEASMDSFRNQLEGFKPLFNDSVQFCREDKLCLCTKGNENCTESMHEDGIRNQPGDPLQRLLHNSIHIILGLGYFGSDASKDPNIRGVMADVAASANDPIFLNHHAMVDCIFETWLQKNPNARYPEDDEMIPNGHRHQDYIVPFFPLYKHSNMFSTADKFGYQCTIDDQSSKNNIKWPKWKIAVIAVVIGTYIIIIIIGIAVFHRGMKSEHKTVYPYTPVSYAAINEVDDVKL